MNNKEYLNEEQYQKTKNKLNKISTILLWLGALMLISSIVSQILSINNFTNLSRIMIMIAPVGVIMLTAGIQLKLTCHRREINAFYAQQQMPIAKEGIEKMAPTAGVAAKEVAKGIKEGLKDEEK